MFKLTNVEYHEDVEAFTQTTEYKTWQDQWKPPHDDTTWVNQIDHIMRYLPDDMANITPREWLATSDISTRIPHYLLETINLGEHRCVDVGCGGNELNKIYPNIWGIDPSDNNRNEELTPTWYTENYEKWDKVISVNAIHFCSIEEIAGNIRKLEDILLPGGSGVITLNARKILLQSDHYTPELLIEQICTVQSVTRVVWLDIVNCMDGNVWIWINK